MAGFMGSKQQQVFPSASFENKDSREDAPSYEDATNTRIRSMPNTVPHLTPYLDLRSRLSQIWLNRWTVLLFILVIRVIFATISFNSDLESARDKAFSACTGVESMGSAMASMPFYMAQGVNELAAKGIESAIRALERTLLLMITGVQEIVVFIVNLMTSTYVCLITLAVRGSVAVAVDALKEITDFVNKAMDGIFNELESEMKTVQDALNDAGKVLQNIPTFIGGKVTIPKIDFPAVNQLKDGLKIPDDFQRKLDDLEANIPTFQEVKEAGDNAIRFPFEILIDTINNTLSFYEFDQSIFPVPQKEELTFCSDNPTINNFFDDLKHVLNKVKNILIGTIVALALLAMIPMGYREWHNYRTTRRTAYMLSDPSRDFDPVDVVYIANNPGAAIFGLDLARKFSSSHRRVLVRWAVAYVTSPPALFVLSLGVTGLASVLSQYILLRQVESRTPALAAEVGQFSGIIIDKLNDASTKWAVETNRAINTTSAEINKEVFGWVKQGTDSLNDTLNVVVDKMHDTVDTFFKDTPLSTAVNDLLDCLITLKIQGIQKGLTWANNNAHITLPTLPNNTFSLGAINSILPDATASSSFLSTPDSVATDKITDVVMKLTNKWERRLKQEAVISGLMTGIWFLLVLIAIVRISFLYFGKDKQRGEGGHAPTNTSQPGNTTGPPAVVFPTFGHSPNTPTGPPSPIVYGNEKFQIGFVNSGKGLQAFPMNDRGVRDSFYPEVET